MRSLAHRRARGFTLIELLIATVIVSVMVVLAFNGLRLGVRSWDAVNARSERSEQMRIVGDFLRRELEHTRRLPVAGAARREVGFSGARDALRFVAPLPGRVALGGLYQLTLEVRRQGSRKHLVLGYELYQGEGWERFSDDLSGEVILHEDIESVEFAYFGVESAQQTPRWRERWEVAGRLPTLIRMRVRVPEGAGRDWPEVLVAPRADTPARTG